MLAAGAVGAFLAVPAERRALEDLASPYTAVRGRGPSSIAAPARPRWTLVDAAWTPKPAAAAIHDKGSSG
jgi:hypothetical protein